MRAAPDRPSPRDPCGWGEYGHSAGIGFDCFEAYTRSEVSGCALSPDFAVKVICYGYGARPRGHFLEADHGRSTKSGMTAPQARVTPGLVASAHACPAPIGARRRLFELYFLDYRARLVTVPL